jgi:enoyl-CoA hydratase/carnithine racemase
MTAPPITVDHDRELDGLVTITLRRPGKLNALDVATHEALQEALVELETDVRARVVVLTGSGRAFSAGADIGSRPDGRPLNDQDRLARVHLGGRTCELIDRLPQVTIGVANGLAVGGGVLLLASCDLRIAADDAWFSVPEVQLGMPLTWEGVPRLMRELGPARTREVVMLCERFTAADAERWGLVNRIHPADDLSKSTRSLAARLLSMDTLALATTKRGCRAAADALVPPSVAWSDAELMLLAYRQGTLGDSSD